jgi:hypothetical protein
MKRIIILTAAILGLAPAMAMAQGPYVSVVATHRHHSGCGHHDQPVVYPNAIDLRPSADALAREASELAQALSFLHGRAPVRGEAFEFAQATAQFARMAQTHDSRQALAFFDANVRPKYRPLREHVYALRQHQSMFEAVRMFPELRLAFLSANRMVADAREFFARPPVVVQPVYPRPNYQVYPPYNQQPYVYYQHSWK